MRFASLGFLLVAACAGEPTEIIVVVDTDLMVPAELDTIQVRTSGSTSSVQTANAPLVGTFATPLPVTVGLVPRDASSRTVNITAAGVLSGADVLTTAARTQF